MFVLYEFGCCVGNEVFGDKCGCCSRREMVVFLVRVLMVVWRYGG